MAKTAGTAQSPFRDCLVRPLRHLSALDPEAAETADGATTAGEAFHNGGARPEQAASF
jgi:hypothetical protein